MSEKTGIEWAHATFNPWIGCTKVSPGCKNCYAETMDRQRYSKTMDGGTKDKPVSHWGPGAPRHRTSAALWKQPLKWNRDAGMQESCGDCDPCIGGYRIIRPRIFPSLCDWLDDEVPIEWLADFLKLIHDTPNLDWLLLSKRPELFFPRLKEVDELLSHGCGLSPVQRQDLETFSTWLKDWLSGKPPINVWVGVSCEDQKRADERIPQLLQIPAKVIFLSVEPLLEKVSLTKLGHDYEYSDSLRGLHRQFNSDGQCRESKHAAIDWVIVGGESGKNRRDCGAEAIENVANQCVAAGVPCFVKQDCAFKPGQQGRIPQEIWSLKQFPKLSSQDCEDK